MRHPVISFFSLLPALLLLLAAPTFAHHLPPGMEEVDEFSDISSFLIGMNHPLSGMDHLLAALLTGVVASRFCKRHRTEVLAAAMGGWLAGSFLTQLPGGEAMLLMSVVAATAIAFLRSERTLMMTTGTLALFHVWHGSAHAVEAPLTTIRGCFIAGAGMATLLIMTLGLALALLVRRWMPVQREDAQMA